MSEQIKKTMGNRTRKRLIFYVLMIAIPIAQTAFFYIGVNLNSFILAFQKYDYIKDASGVITGQKVVFAGFDNFKAAFSFFDVNSDSIGRSLILFLTNTFLAMPLALIFSFYIYKKKPMAGFFKVLLFMPQIVSALIFSLLYKYILDFVYTDVVEKLTGEVVIGLTSPSSPHIFGTVLVYSIIMSFGVNIILFSGSMSGIDESVVEAAHLDGVTVLQEFIYVTLPMIYPTIVSFLVIGMGKFCIDQMYLFGMYGNGAKDSGTLGYMLYLSATSAKFMPEYAGDITYSELAAVSIILSLIVVPTILFAKRLLNKFGPSVE